MTSGLLYNLYADRLLGLNLVPQSIYDMQSAFYPTVAQTYGVPLDTRNVVTKCNFSSFHSTPSSRLTINHSGLANVDRSHSFPLDESNVHLSARKVDQ